MIKNLKPNSEKALINNETVRKYLIRLDSDLLRGVNTLLILDTISKCDELEGFGYKIIQILKEKSHYSINLEEATLYTLLKSLERVNLLESKKQKKRKIFSLTSYGKVILDYGMGFYSTISQLLVDFDRHNYSQRESVIFCPNCSNRILIIPEEEIKYCIICGYFVGNLVNDFKNRKYYPLFYKNLSPELLYEDNKNLRNEK